jgi:hypothetical protein
LKKQYTVVCGSSGECNDAIGLICPSTTGTCNCPVTSNSIFCDCKRVANSEYYWNGSSCTAVKATGSSCSNSSSSYMCQTLTQGMICNNTSGSFKCECPYLKYYNNITNVCTNQLTINQTCSFETQCQTVNGLSCINGFCKCLTTSYWDNTKCGMKKKEFQIPTDITA